MARSTTKELTSGSPMKLILGFACCFNNFTVSWTPSSSAAISA